jgi:beta-lactamase class A
VVASTVEAKGRFESKKAELLKILEPAGGTWGIFIEDLDGKGSIMYNHKESFTAASVIKIPIMMTAFAEARKGNVRLDDTIVLRKEDKVGGSGVLKELHTGLNLTLLDAIILMIIVSDNTGTNLVIDSVGLETVNAYLEERGYGTTRLEAHLMRPKPQGPWNKITARDIAFLLKGIVQRTLDNPGDCDTMMNILSRQQLRSKLPRLLPRGVICANKTGEVRRVTHDAGIVKGEGVNFVIVCLSQNLEDTTVGVKVIGEVAKWAYDILVN